jgi:copper chaperone
MLKSITFEVVGDQRIVCDGCEQRIEKLLKSVEGVDKARASMKNQRIDVLFDAARLDAGAIAERLENAGYEVTVAPAS